MDFDPEIFKNQISSGGEIFFEGLEKHIRKLEAGLEEDEQLVVLHHQTRTTIHVQHIEYKNPSMFILYGKDSNNNLTSIFANVSSLQLELKILKNEEKEEKEPIGFSKN